MPHRRPGLHFSVHAGVCGMKATGHPRSTPEGVLIDAQYQGNLFLKTLALVGER